MLQELVLKQLEQGTTTFLAFLNRSKSEKYFEVSLFKGTVSREESIFFVHVYGGQKIALWGGGHWRCYSCAILLKENIQNDRVRGHSLKIFKYGHLQTACKKNSANLRFTRVGRDGGP